MKNTVKTLLSGLTTLAVAFSAMSFTALATENKDANDMTELIISSHEAYAGDIVTVTVDIKNNPGITAFGSVLNYDSELEFVEYEIQGLMAMTNIQSLNTKIAVVAASPSAVFKDRSFVNLVFKVPENAQKGMTYEVNWISINELSENGEEKTNTQINGCITVIEKEEPASEQKIGNINSDGKIDAKDATIILKNYGSIMLNQSIEISKEQLELADVNNDGLVNAADATLVLKYYGMSLLNPNITWEDVLNS